MLYCLLFVCIVLYRDVFCLVCVMYVVVLFCFVCFVPYYIVLCVSMSSVFFSCWLFWCVVHDLHVAFVLFVSLVVPFCVALLLHVFVLFWYVLFCFGVVLDNICCRSLWCCLFVLRCLFLC